MTKPFTCLCVTLIAACLCTAPARAASLGQPGGGGGGGGGGQPQRGQASETVSVERAMKSMNRAMRPLRKIVGDPSQKAEALRLVGDMQRGCLAAKSQPLPKDVLEHAADDAAKAKLAVAFRHDLIELMRQLLDLEELIDAGKSDEATAKLADIVKLRDRSHDQMGIRDEPAGGTPQGKNDGGE